MYSWKRIRAISAVLLLIPIVHLSYLVSRSTVATLDNSPEAWRDEVDAYSAQDALAPAPRDPIVVVGGKRVRLWEQLPEALAPRPVLMRGLGEAIIEDIIYFYAPLIGYYQPRTVVLLPGRSEFFIRDDKMPEDFLAATRELAALDEAHRSQGRLIIISPIKTPRSPQDYARIDKITELLRDWSRREERVAILDANRLLADPEGMPRPQYFRPDGSSLNEHGYLRLSVLLQTRIEQDEQTAELIDLSS